MNAAFKKEQGRSFSKEASMAKVFTTESANKACYEAMQIFGGYGYTSDFPIERYTRDVRITTIYEGTSEVQRLIISRDILGQFS
jgi:alkylation response protein AidB-like acyl-CoA dehydrogenase